MRVIKKEPGAEPEIIEVENELQALQDAVGGTFASAGGARISEQKGVAAVEKMEDSESPNIFSGTATGERLRRWENVMYLCETCSKGERCDRRLWRKKGAERVAAVEKMEDSESLNIFSGTATGG